jgi:uncharacterized membrane protein
MKFFTIFGDLLFRLFDIIGMIILEIPKIPNRIRNIDTDNFKNRVDSEAIKDNITKIKNDTRLKEGISKISKMEISDVSEKFENVTKNENVEVSKYVVSDLSEDFTSEEKEKTVFRLQLLSAAFLVVSMIFIFNFLALWLYGVIGLIIVSYIVYIIFTKVKLMYPVDFNAYRDFFLMYIAVGILLVLVGTNPNFVMTYSFEFLPSLSVLIFAVLAVGAVFLIFRIRYHRNFTYGKVMETSRKNAQVKVDYDIRSNVKPDIYMVDNSYGAHEDDLVVLQIEEKLWSVNGNKPVRINGVIK